MIPRAVAAAALGVCAALAFSIVLARAGGGDRANAIANAREAFVTPAVAGVCGLLDMEALESRHGEEKIAQLRFVCNDTEKAASHPGDSGVCVEGCDSETLCGLPMLKLCSQFSGTKSCDVTLDTLYDLVNNPRKPREVSTGHLPGLYSVRRGTCLSVDANVSDPADWPLCVCTDALFVLLSGFPSKVHMYFSTEPSEYDMLRSWTAVFRGGGGGRLRLPVEGVSDPPDGTAAIGAAGGAGVRAAIAAVPTFSLVTTSTDPTRAVSEASVRFTPESLRSTLDRYRSPDRAAATLYGEGVSLGNGLDYGEGPGAVSPLSRTPLEPGARVYVRLLWDIETGGVREFCEIIPAPSEGSFTFVCSRDPAAELAVVDLDAMSAPEMWLGFRDYRLFS